MASKYNFDDAINAFFIESREMLEDMENALLELEKNISDTEPIPAIFRAAHTIKGSAGMFGFADIGDFTHVVEDLLDDVRNNAIALEPEMVSLLLECHDHILKLLDFFDSDRKAKIDASLKSGSDRLLKQLSLYLPEAEVKTAGKNIPEKDEGSLSEIQVINECWHISLRFGKDVFRNGFDPQSFINYLGQMGKLVKIKTISDAIPPMQEMDPRSCYLDFEISFMGYTSKEKIEEVFEFVRDDCRIRILPPRSNLSEYVRLIKELPGEPMHIGEILIETGSLTRKELEEALKLQIELTENNNKKRIGEVIIDEKMVHQPVVEAAISKQSDIKKSEEKTKKSMRIDTSKLDVLINLVGEVVITAADVEQRAKNTGDVKLVKKISQLSKLIDDIRENSMNIRMVEIGELFKRFERLVRDISREKGKKVDLVLNGGETELDKTIIEKVTDPLMHLVRNAVDHGIDTPEERIAKGKTPAGRVTLNAFHESGNIVIEISDDGSGLNKDRIINKAIEKGLLKQDQVKDITDDDLHRLIFMPGFSTAEKITDISGRGVGMDVVKKNIDSLRGSVNIQSKEGRGTSVQIYLPLTLAIIEGFLVKAGKQFCVLPLAVVSECAGITVSKDELRQNENGDYINLRGEAVPFLRIRDFFKEEGEIPENESIVIASYARKKIGLIVDEVFGELQTVIKPLGKIFKKLDWISGATILGGGEIGLILDVPKLIRYLQAVEIKKVS